MRADLAEGLSCSGCSPSAHPSALHEFTNAGFQKLNEHLSAAALTVYNPSISDHLQAQAGHQHPMNELLPKLYGQPYEVKMNYNNTGEKSRLLKSVFRVSFHERRMQFMEKEHMDYWRQSRPGERILDVDAALSYNARQVYAVPSKINVAEVIWDGGYIDCDADGGNDSSNAMLSTGRQVNCGVFVKLHCISTEFTARKHGGEKGIPFRLQIDTFDHSAGDLLCSVAAQVKVFKPKGADRKHKTDREKVEKRSDAERSKYQPPLPYTPFLPLNVLSDGADSGGTGGDIDISGQRDVAAFSIGDLPRPAQQPLVRHHQQQQALAQAQAQYSGVSIKRLAAVAPAVSHRPAIDTRRRVLLAPAAGGSGSDCDPKTPETSSAAGPSASPPEPLTNASSPQQVSDWLERNRFSPNLIRAFQQYNGADMLQLSRADLIEICGVGDGIRLCNAIMQRPCRARLLFYVGQETENVFHPVYLNQLTYPELFAKVTNLFQSDSDKITQILVSGPGTSPSALAMRFRIVMKEYQTCCDE
uniref:Grh/CP2 DB domain-containing protein n=1 Tax=Macrostomum lignano TaxID=282301 RepID=A0A1I8F224_9PLAT